MGTNYPAGFDNFIEPTLPEETPLSSAGSGDRNHTEHHRDLGDAIESIQVNAALKGHDHSGDEDDIAKGPKLTQANTHEDVDTDETSFAIHHTLGTTQYQAAAGNHVHDYTGQTIVNKPFENVLSSARPANPVPGEVIWERDTNRMRVWAQFPGMRQAVQGLYYTDKFERTSSTSLGTGWTQSYTLTSGAGKMATPDGNAASWIEEGDFANRCIAQRTDAATRRTLTSDQVITFNTNEHVADWDNPDAENPASNDAYFRMSDDGQTYVRAALTWWKGATGSIMLTYTTTGPVGEQLIGQLPAPTNEPNILWQLRLVGTKFEAYVGVSYVGAINDNMGVTNTGHKGWGFGMQAGDPWGGSQAIPNEISEVGIADATYFTSSTIWQLLPVGDIPKVGLAVTSEQAINPTGSVIEWGHVEEDNFGFFDLAQPDHITVKEPGIYHVHASIVWGTELRGDHAATVILVNGQRTPHMHWEFVRGHLYVPGFAQTVDCSAYLRLAEGDRVSVAAAHNGNGDQWTGCKKEEEITQLSRFMMVFHSA